MDVNNDKREVVMGLPSILACCTRPCEARGDYATNEPRTSVQGSFRGGHKVSYSQPEDMILSGEDSIPAKAFTTLADYKTQLSDPSGQVMPSVSRHASIKTSSDTIGDFTPRVSLTPPPSRNAENRDVENSSMFVNLPDDLKVPDKKKTLDDGKKNYESQIADYKNRLTHADMIHGHQLAALESPQRQLQSASAENQALKHVFADVFELLQGQAASMKPMYSSFLASTSDPTLGSYNKPKELPVSVDPALEVGRKPEFEPANESKVI